MVNKAYSIFLLCLLTACGGVVDLRHADIVVPQEDILQVQDAISFWQRAGAELDWVITDKCTYDFDRECLEIKDGELGTMEFGEYRLTLRGAKITIAQFPWTREIYQEVLRHEMGHAMGLNHTKDGFDVMTDDGLGGFKCVTAETNAQWKQIYGVGLKEICEERY